MLSRIRGMDVLPSASNPDPISDLNMAFFTPVFRPGLACYNFSTAIIVV